MSPRCRPPMCAAEASPRDRVERRDFDALSERGVVAEGVALEEADDRVAWVEGVWILPIVGLIGKLHAPVRRHEAEALPAPSPGLRYPSLLEHDMRDAVLGELVTGCKPGLTGAHDHDIEEITQIDASLSSVGDEGQRGTAWTPIPPTTLMIRGATGQDSDGACSGILSRSQLLRWPRPGKRMEAAAPYEVRGHW